MPPSPEMTICDPSFNSSVWLNYTTPINPMLMTPRGAGASLTVAAEGLLELSLPARKTIAKIRSFASLQENWDGNDADSVHSSAIEKADMFVRKMDRMRLPIYFVSPTRDGGVMIEFDNRKGKAAEIFMNRSGQTYMLLINENEMAESTYNELDLMRHFNL